MLALPVSPKTSCHACQVGLVRTLTLLSIACHLLQIPILQVLLGYFVIPSVVQKPINAVINPAGDAERSVVRVWNLDPAGEQRIRLIICSNPALQRAQGTQRGPDVHRSVLSSSSAVDSTCRS